MSLMSSGSASLRADRLEKTTAIHTYEFTSGDRSEGRPCGSDRGVANRVQLVLGICAEALGIAWHPARIGICAEALGICCAEALGTVANRVQLVLGIAWPPAMLHAICASRRPWLVQLPVQLPSPRASQNKS